MALWQVERDAQGILVATYLNPPMNYFCAEGTQELGERIREWSDPGIRAVVLTGGIRGKFITHYSVEELAALAANHPLMRALGLGLNHGYHELLRSLRDLAKPVIAALNGDTMGGGFELSLSCDIRVASAGDHRIGLPEATLGILPGGSGTQRLSRLIGAGRALDFILRGRICRPEEALELGLVHEVAPDALVRARALAAGFVQLSPVALAEIKRAVHRGSDGPLDAGLAVESESFMATMFSKEALEAMRAYVALPFSERRSWLERHGALIHPQRSR
ncbi:MAG TPA: enoyl-CoA hydratase/isomerase family protein [Myxococcota bacterium]|nr:enoyl-CoA hydratase/isomerase family protein [Myxococcota bacterium]